MKSFEFEVNNPRNVLREELFILQTVERVLAGYLTSVTSIDQSLYCEILARRRKNNMPIQPLHQQIMELIKQSLEQNNIPMKEDKVLYKIKTVATQRNKYVQRLTTREQQTTENNTQFSSPKHSTRGKYIILGKPHISNKTNNYLYLNKSQQLMTSKKQNKNQFQTNSSQLETENTKDNHKLLLQNLSQNDLQQQNSEVSKFEHIMNETMKNQHSKERLNSDGVVQSKNQPYFEPQLKTKNDVKLNQKEPVIQNIQEKPQKAEIKKKSKKQYTIESHNTKDGSQERITSKTEGNFIINHESERKKPKIIESASEQKQVEKQNSEQQIQKQQQIDFVSTPQQKRVRPLDLTNQQANYQSEDDNVFSPQNTAKVNQYFQRQPNSKTFQKQQSNELEAVSLTRKQNSKSQQQDQPRKSNIFIYHPQPQEPNDIQEQYSEQVPMVESLKFQITVDQVNDDQIIPKKQNSLFLIPHQDDNLQNRQTSIQQINIQISQCSLEEQSERIIEQDQVISYQQKHHQQSNQNSNSTQRQYKNDEKQIHKEFNEQREFQQSSSPRTNIQQLTPQNLQIQQFSDQDNNMKQYKSSSNIVIPSMSQINSSYKQNSSTTNKSRNEKSSRSKDPNQQYQYQKSEDSQPGSKQTIDISQGEKPIKSKNVKKLKQLQLPTSSNITNPGRRKSSNVIQPFDAKKHEQQEKDRRRQSEYQKLLDQIKLEREFMEQFTMPENMSLNQKKALIEHLISQLDNNQDQELKYQIMLYKQRQEQISQIAKQELIFNSSQNTCYNEIEQLAEQKIKSLNKEDLSKTSVMKFGNQVQINFTTGSKQTQEADSPLKRNYKVLSNLHPIEIERQIHRMHEFKQEGELLNFFKSFNSLYNKEVIIIIFQVNQCDLDYPTDRESLSSAKPGTGFLSTATTRKQQNMKKTTKLGVQFRRIKQIQQITKKFKTQESIYQ